MAQEEQGHSLNMQGYVRRVKDHLELSLARDVKDNQKGFSATNGRLEKMGFHC